MGSSKQTERESLRAVFVEDNEFAFKLAFCRVEPKKRPSAREFERAGQGDCLPCCSTFSIL